MLVHIYYYSSYNLYYPVSYVLDTSSYQDSPLSYLTFMTNAV